MSEPANPLDGFTVTADDVWFTGTGLNRPECILATPDGALRVSDGRGGVTLIRPDGTQRLIRQQMDDRFIPTVDDTPEGHSEPNGLAFDSDGSLLIANFGMRRLERMDPDGRTTIVLDTLDGTPLGKANFVMRDRQNRIWLTISTNLGHQREALRPTVADGSLVVIDNDGARVVADGFAFTNECRFDANEEWLYVAETAGRRITRLRIGDGARVLAREVFGPANTGGFVDGIAFDAFGNLWGTQIMSDRIFAITPEGAFRVILDDDNPAASAALQEAFERDALTPNHIQACGGTLAPFFASITFGGPDLRTVYIGSIKGTRLPAFRSPVAGLPLTHWS
ncbi:MAG: SMP-30/gluconolactonase/LRE family protein [Rhodobacteraceae bacterium]|nr:SMP-30/gluconolactonase/LRE family protein [Paracoccaceae bacterium]